MANLKLVEQTAPFMGKGFSADEVRAMQKAMVQLAVRWDLTDEQMAILLGDISKRTFARWKEGKFGRAGVDTCARMSNLLGIHKALRLLFKDAARGYGWIKRDNDALGGRTALSVMLDGQLTDIMRVRQYLDGQRAPW